MDFRIKTAEILRTVKADKASATVIEAGDLVAMDDSRLIIKAVADSAAIAYAPNGAGNGETEIDVTVGNDFTLVGTAKNNFAVTQKGTEVDLVGTTNLLIDNNATTTKVLKIGIAKDSGVANSKANVEVRINKPLF